MRARERAACTLGSAKAAQKLLVRQLAAMVIDNVGKSLDLNTGHAWGLVGRWRLLEQILFSEDKI